MATEVTLKNVVAYVLLKSTHEELTTIAEAMRLRRSTLSQRAVAKFRRGQRVTFRNRTGNMVAGVVERVLQKNVQVKSEAGMVWRVPAAMLIAHEVGAGAVHLGVENVEVPWTAGGV